MKVAIEFYGHLRTFRKTCNSIKTFLINQYENPDIFIHTWDETDHSGLTWHNQSCEKRGNSVSEDDIDFLNQNYNPKKILIEPQIKIENDTRHEMIMTGNTTPLSVIKNVFYTKWKVNELRREYEKESGVKYDFVIQARLDLQFNRPFVISDYIVYKQVINEKKVLNIDISNKFYYASDHWIDGFKNNDILYAGGSDILYFAKPEAMNKVVSVYNKIDDLDLDSMFYSNEYLMLNNSAKEKLESIEILFKNNIDFIILRPWTNQAKIKVTIKRRVKSFIKRVLKRIASFLLD